MITTVKHHGRFAIDFLNAARVTLAGCAIQHRFGDHDGGMLSLDAPRVILAGRVA